LSIAELTHPNIASLVHPLSRRAGKEGFGKKIFLTFPLCPVYRREGRPVPIAIGRVSLYGQKMVLEYGIITPLSKKMFKQLFLRRGQLNVLTL
jgi:hypothetical protein